ncbi:MAG: polynucleotide kinase-phosphatase [Phycisphaerales bacterium]|nr:polynucleotide kinase-phosphatase [Phycisphaerales bacterium]
MNITVPELSLVVLIGASGSGKSTLARRLFKPTEILSSDTCRGWVSDDENSQEATGDAFDVLHFVARRRLARGLLTVVDATNIRPEDRQPLVEIAREFHCLPVAIVIDVPERLCHERNATRPDRQFGPHVIRNQRRALSRSVRFLEREGFRYVHRIRTPEECDAATLAREPLWTNRKHETGPFDIIGDVHGCYDELIDLLKLLGYHVESGDGEADVAVAAPHDPPRKLIFLGDLCDRGPKTPAVLRLVMRLVAEGRALCVPGNHDVKLMRALAGRNVQITHGLAESLAQLAAEPESFRDEVREFLDRLVSHYVLDGGRLVVAHAGMKQSMQGRGSRAVREFALYGETTGETDEFGLPVRYNWAAEYRGPAAVVYGHTPVPEPEWLNNTVCIDTGCVFGGALTALRWPEREFVSVSARAPYAESRRPFLEVDAAPISLQQSHDALLDIADVTGKRIIDTRLQRSITVHAANATAALEVMSRFAIDPRLLIYLPPTMSPCETSRESGLLEHPREAFEYFRTAGIGRVICQEKHMGSRAVAIVCREPAVLRKRFGVAEASNSLGVIYTRTGRPFFDNRAVEVELLTRLRDAISSAALWKSLSTDWLCLDCELMPWSAKAQSLIREQYAAVGVAAATGLSAAVESLHRAADHTPEAAALADRFAERRALVDKFTAAYRNYCWPVERVDDLRLAPFHILAGESRAYAGIERQSAADGGDAAPPIGDHRWHMAQAARIAAAGDPVFLATPSRVVDLSSESSEAAATQWWFDITSSGSEGMVVKPLEFIARGPRGLLQPAIKVRGSEYLRIIYGPEYTLPENLDRLRSRALGAKRSLATREFALGIEALERFVRREPLRRVHECVFSVLAMESEPVDPRL